MSNIYIQEPPTNGKVIIKTSLGEIEIELWSKECPKTCRNFVQLCLEGYYDGNIFHRIVKDFIAQTGDPTGTGQGGESIYGEPFKDEFHSRLRFNRRGLVGMANSDKDDNGSQFFFTLGNTPELTKKHTLFAKIVGNTIFNMIQLNECELIDERPVRPPKIISCEVIYNPFSDIVPRNLKAARVSSKDDDNKLKQKGVKNYGLLSFGDEAEDDEDELESATQVFKPKAKSAHDVGDPSLLSKPVTESNLNKKNENDSDETSETSETDEEEQTSRKIDSKEKIDINSIKSKLSKKDIASSKQTQSFKSVAKGETIKDEKRKQTQLEIMKLEKELSDKKKKQEQEEVVKKEKKTETEVVKKYKEDVEKYEGLKKTKTKNSKEDKTLEMLNAFRERLFKAKKVENADDEEIATKEEDEEKDEKDEKKSIWTHKLEIEEEIKQKVIDANIADHERYDIFDPRNPLNKRKREESHHIMKDKKHSGHSSGSRYDKR